MTTTGLDVFDKAVQKANLWLKDLMKLLRWGDRRKTFTALQAVLRTLRDRLTREEAFQLGGQLPMILRGYYFGGWETVHAPWKERKRSEFFARMRQHLGDLPEVDPEVVTRAVFVLLSRHISAGELEDVLGSLPESIRTFGMSDRAPSEPRRMPLEERRRSRARKARKEIRATLARARAEGIHRQDLPIFLSRQARRKQGRRRPETRP